MSIVDWIYPRFCVGCQREGQYICDECRVQIVRCGSSLRYTGLVRKIIKGIKYRGTYDMVQELVDIWCPSYEDSYTDSVVTAVPMWVPKEKQRGYNQADLIAREVARRWNLRYSPLLVRTRCTRPMYGLTRTERADNIRGAFALHRGVYIPEKVILVDDVWTTGATIAECAQVLRRSGNMSVTPLVLAR